MPEQTPEPAPFRLPDRPNLTWLRKQAKTRLAELRRENPAVKLADAEVTPLHLAAAHGHAKVVQLLLDAGADPRIRDTKHDGDAFGWAEFFQKPEIVRLLKDKTTNG